MNTSSRSEDHLNKGVQQSFLNLWTVPNPFQQPGKELADIFVAFGDDLMIISDTELARQFVAAIRRNDFDPEKKVGDKRLADWLDWAEKTAQIYDPILQGAVRIFGSVSQITEWTYRD